jgi:hypothetical protein
MCSEVNLVTFDEPTKLEDEHTNKPKSIGWEANLVRFSKQFNCADDPTYFDLVTN